MPARLAGKNTCRRGLLTKQDVRHCMELESALASNDQAKWSNIPIVVLISGGGTTLRNLLERQAAGALCARVVAVVSSNAKAKGNQFAIRAGIPLHIVERSEYDSPEAFRTAVFDPCRAARAELVVMGGFLKHVLIPDDFFGRVINIHPSLLPKFGGKGFYGARVHQAVLDAGETTSGCTVHFVDDLFDHGPVILQRSVKVQSNDTAATLAARIFLQECEALPEALQLIAAGQVLRPQKVD